MITRFIILGSALCALAAFPATITFPTLTATGSTNDVTFVVKTIPEMWSVGGDTIQPTEIEFTTVNGTYSTNLVAGEYSVSIKYRPYSWRIRVPDDDETYTMTEVVGPGLVRYTYPNWLGGISSRVLPGTNVVFQTNGLAGPRETLTISAAASSGGSGTLTNFGQLTASTIYVSPDGDDDTGSRADPNLPFATPNAAQAAAEPGDNIEVMPGYYSATNLGANYVNWYLHEGSTLSAGTNAVYTLTNATCWITGSGSVTNETATLPVLTAEGSTVRLGANWLGTFSFNGSTNSIEFFNATIYSVDGLWLSGSDSTVVRFEGTSALNLPVTDCTLAGTLRVDPTLTP